MSNRVGFSTGAVAKGDFLGALELLANTTANAIELSALRMDELAPLVDALGSLDLRKYDYVAVHAPSSFSVEEEPLIINLLLQVSRKRYWIVVHPDALHNVRSWSVFGEYLCIENMDKRKSVGRTVAELESYFELLPQASLCFDIAHARQVDGSMMEAYKMLKAYYGRIRQIHVSEIGTLSKHTRMSAAAAADYREVAGLVPPGAAIIVEAPVQPGQIQSELEASQNALSSVAFLKSC